MLCHGSAESFGLARTSFLDDDVVPETREPACE
jgi:hypothetical protein